MRKEGGKNDMCKAIQDLMADSKEEGRESALIEAAKNLLDVLSDEMIAEKLGFHWKRYRSFAL
ncbi:MAG: hypothetical protein IKJ16_07705 [Agathobacter sp.]|nr:hypothetical protein [Agathobacter sp.]